MQEAVVQQIVFYKASGGGKERGRERESRASCKQLRLAGSISGSRSRCVCGWQRKVGCGEVTADLPTAVKLIALTAVCSWPCADCC
jgi:hypothetical protein